MTRISCRNGEILGIRRCREEEKQFRVRRNFCIADMVRAHHVPALTTCTPDSEKVRDGDAGHQDHDALTGMII
jgi:hypothetical protein